jgi:hypothetical protein
MEIVAQLCFAHLRSVELRYVESGYVESGSALIEEKSIKRTINMEVYILYIETGRVIRHLTKNNYQ